MESFMKKPVTIVLAVVALLSFNLSPLNADGPLRRLARAVNNARPGIIFGHARGAHSQNYGQTVVYSDGGYQTAQPQQYGGYQAYSYAGTGGGSLADVGVGTAAWQHCRREAEMLAARGIVQHLTGVAPGGRMQGVGSSHSPSDPNHCVGQGLIARAGVQGAGSKWYWSAVYAR